MAESSLSVSKTDLDAAIAVELGINPSAPITGANGQMIDRVRKSGLRSVYYALAGDQQGTVEWSFTNPPATLALVAGTGDYDLPDDFGWVGAIGPRLVFSSGSNFVSAEKVDSHTLLEARARESSSTLTATINDSVLTLAVDSVRNFPVNVLPFSTFTIKIDSEYLRVTAVSETTFTVTRAFGGTSAASHTAGAIVEYLGTPKRFAIRPRVSVSTLDGEINSAVLSLDVVSARPFPTVPFTILIDSEQIRVTAVAAETFTVTRGYASTTAASHADGAVVALVNVGQRFEILVFPKPDTAQTVAYRYAIQPDDVTAALPYPLGGAQHGETYMLACLSQCELRIKGEAGPLTAEFKQQLGASVVMDRRARMTESEQFPVAPATIGSYGWLASELGRVMEIGANPSLWTWSEQESVRSAINRGVSEVLKPATTGNPRHRGHRWSFLSSIQTLLTSAPQSSSTVTIVDGVVTLAAGTWPSWAAQGTLSIAGVMYFVASFDPTTPTVLVLENTTVNADPLTEYSLGRERYTLPSTLWALDPTCFTFEPGLGYPPVRIVHTDTVQQSRRYGYYSAYPFMVALANHTPDTGAVTSRYLWLFPTPNAAFQLTYRVRSTAPFINEGDFPPGGSELATTYLAAAKSAHNPQYQPEFLAMLGSAIDQDQELFQSAPLGENRDDSDYMRWQGVFDYGRHRYSTGNVYGEAYP